MSPSLTSLSSSLSPEVVVALFVAFGVVVGAYGTLIGAGGGFLVVPVLLLLGYPHDEAVGTSLVVVTANALSGSVAYLRQRRVDVRTALLSAAATVPGAVVGSLVVEQLSGRLFTIAFGVILVAVSTFLIVRPPRTSLPVVDKPAGWRGAGWTVRRFVDRAGESYAYGFSMPPVLVLSFVVGFVSSILGIGGGTIHVPALVAVFQFPAHVATATSHLILGISAAVGSATHAVLAHVDVVPAAAMSAGAVVGAQIGGALSTRLKAVWLVRALAAALGLVGVRLIVSAW